MTTGTIHGVGLGPGAADLMSVRADRLVRATRHIAYFRKAGRPGHARRIAADLLRPDAVEIAMEYVGDPPWLDLDNLAKAILDAIKGYVFHDDAQVARLLVERRPGERERITVTVRKIGELARSAPAAV